MTKEEAIKRYSKRFGGFPYMLYGTASDELIIADVEEALRTGREIEAPDDGCVY